MSRVIPEEKAILDAAAEAVRPMIEKLEKQRAKLDARIARLQAVVMAADSSSGRRTKIAGTNGSEPPGDQPTYPRGQVGKHIREIMSDGGIYSETELRQKLLDRFRVTYGRGAVYSALQRGKKNGEYEKNGRRWVISLEAIVGSKNEPA
jgi:hypothetical protein